MCPHWPQPGMPREGGAGEPGRGKCPQQSRAERPLQMLEANGDCVLELLFVWHTRKDACWLCRPSGVRGGP